MRTRKRVFTIEGHTVELMESSAVMAGNRHGPFLWLCIDEPDRPEAIGRRVWAHASRSEVRRIRDALTDWLTDTGDPS